MSLNESSRRICSSRALAFTRTLAPYSGYNVTVFYRGFSDIVTILRRLLKHNYLTVEPTPILRLKMAVGVSPKLIIGITSYLPSLIL